MTKRNKHFSNLIEKLNWEHWPTYMFYIPLLPLYIYYSLRSGSFTYFVATNPAIKNGGDATESKFDTLKLLPKTLIPKSVFVPSRQNIKTVNENLKKEGLYFPLIIKPDIGYRGLLVKKLNNQKDLEVYLKKYSNINFIIQEFVNYKNECGILYVRYPEEQKGKITSITIKKYLGVKGDGKSSVAELINKDKHAQRYHHIYQEQIVQYLDYQPKKNETFLLNEIGNHCKGAAFLNGNHLISDKLNNTFDKISKNVKGVFFGRYDLKYNNFDELEKGKDFKIIELNGVIAEPTHIYDAPNSSYFYALKSIAKHWKYVYQISKINHKKGVKYKKFGPVIKGLLALRPYNKMIKKLSKI